MFKFRSLELKILAVAAIVVLTGWFLLNAFQGRMLGALVGTTTDPRTALGDRSFGASMEPRLFTLRDRTYRPFGDGLIGKPMPRQTGERISFAIPEAYLYNVRSEPDGWSRRTTGVAIRVSSQTFRPYRTEWFPIRKEVAEYLEIDLISPDEADLRRIKDRDRRVKRQKLQERRLQDTSYPLNQVRSMRYRAPDTYSHRRLKEELLRRGFAEVLISVGVGPHLDRKERERRMLVSAFGSLEDYQTSKGCAQRPGPWPNSTRFEPSPSVLRARGPRGLNGAACFGHSSPKSTYAFVQKDADGEIEFTVICATHNQYARSASCKTWFFWKGIWPMTLNVTGMFQSRIPDFIAKARALFDGFEDGAHPVAGSMG